LPDGEYREEPPSCPNAFPWLSARATTKNIIVAATVIGIHVFMSPSFPVLVFILPL
jgi:hypothetical protein